MTFLLPALLLKILFIYSILIDGASCENESGTLVLVNVVYRHGDRTPVSPYPTDPYRNVSFWPVGWGQLTNRGKEQHFELGKWLRERYDHFLPEEYSRDDIYIRSTDVDRTLMSAESNLAGLYPPTGSQRWNPTLSWQPIPIHTTPEIDDMILAGKKLCPRYNKALEAVMNSVEMKELNRKNKQLYEYLSKHSGAEIHDLVSLEYLYDTLHVEDLYNLTLPEWTQSVFPEKMAGLAAYSFTFQAFTPLLQRLKSGPLLKELISNMEKAIYEGSGIGKKMYMYSAHDSTVANLLMTLGVFDAHSPPYTAMILMELWKNADEEYNVVISYRNSSADPSVLTLTGCRKVCPYEKFIALTKTRVPGNWEEECSVEVVYEFRLNSLSIIALALSGLLAVLLTSSILFSILYWRKKKSASYYYHHVHTEEQ
ncbi:hypothetical protein R5R35_010392 [Gryllus longicercus]|uniref:acid phosphatase n=1 Tax=Gryllus longicercus TaxID=2509291 RepID=A0AAN9VDR7_9ORTH